MIEAIQLSHAVGRKPILKSLDFSIAKNDFVLIFGPNGAGKSTLLKLLAGLLAVEKGDIFIGKKNILHFTKKELARQIAYLPQFDEFSLPLTVGDVLLSGRYPYGSLFKRYSRQDHEQVEKTAARFSLTELVDRNMQTLSGGERKKVLLAGAFIQDVPLILLDEPLNFLDPASALQVMKMLGEMHDAGKTIMLVSHLIQYFFPRANKMLALKDGAMCYFGAKKFSTRLFREIYQVEIKRTLIGNKEIIYVDE